MDQTKVRSIPVWILVTSMIFGLGSFGVGIYTLYEWVSTSEYFLFIVGLVSLYFLNYVPLRLMLSRYKEIKKEKELLHLK